MSRPQSQSERDVVRTNVNPKVYALDNGIEVWRWDGKDSGKQSKPPVVVVHGGGGSVGQWAKLAPEIAKSGRTVFGFSWYHHGKSKRLPEEVFVRRSILDISRDELTAMADHVLDEMPGHEQFDLIGVSMGGAAALGFAASSPEAVRHLALVSPVVPAEFGGEIIPIPVDPFKPAAPGDAEQQRQLFEPTTPKDISYTHYLQSYPESPVAIWESTRWTLDINVRDIKAKTLAITADPELDRITPPKEIIEMAKAMGARHHTIKQVGHGEALYLDPHWRNLSKMLVEFLDEK